jgi:hypothetical protein
MRTFAKLAVALLLGLAATAASAHINFVKARMLSLDQRQDRWVLELEIHGMDTGSREPVIPPKRVTLQIMRAPTCIYHKQIYLGTPEEFERALDILRTQVADGKIHVFGLNASRVDEEGGKYISPNLRVGEMLEYPVVWAVAREPSGVRCPLQFVEESQSQKRKTS